MAEHIVGLLSVPRWQKALAMLMCPLWLVSRVSVLIKILKLKSQMKHFATYLCLCTDLGECWRFASSRCVRFFLFCFSVIFPYVFGLCGHPFLLTYRKGNSANADAREPSSRSHTRYSTENIRFVSISLHHLFILLY